MMNGNYFQLPHPLHFNPFTSVGDKAMAYRINESACIGCTLCAKNCPVKAITGTLKEPHHIDENVCVGCGACGRLCPKGAVLNGKGEPAAKV